MDYPLVLGCGGAGIRFARYAGHSSHGRILGINDSSANIIVSRDKLKMVSNLNAELAIKVFPWISEIIEAEERTVFVIAGLGGVVGTFTAELIGIALGHKKNLIGLFSEPFTGEAPERRDTAKGAIKRMKEHYRIIIPMSNTKLIEYYSNLPISDAMKIHPVVMRHIIQDFERFFLKEDVPKLGLAGVGVGFGAGRERIRVAINDALDSPWLSGGRKIALISGDVDREDVAVVMRDYDFDRWEFYRTEEYGEEIKTTILSH